MKKHIKLTAALAATGITLAASSATAATVIVSEDWQSPLNSEATQLDDTAIFTGWEFTQGGGNIFKSRLSNSSTQFMPQAGLANNQGLQFEWAGQYAAYDTTHNWSASDVYQVTFNATEMNWGNANDRRVAFRIREVIPGDNTFGATLYTAFADLAEYDSAHAGSGNDWAANQFFTFDFDAGDFTGGTEGTALSFEIGSEDPGAGYDRGLSVDNITFTLVPEPTTAALLGLGGLALILRRRK